MGTRTRVGLSLMSQSQKFNTFNNVVTKYFYNLVVFIPQGSIMRLVKMKCLQLRYEMHL